MRKLEQTKDRGTVTGLKVVLVPIAIFICLAFSLKLLYSIPLRDSFLWYVGIFLYFYIPGNLLLRLIGFKKDEYFINIFHSIALGAALIPLIYMILRRISHPELLYPLIIIMPLVWICLTASDYKRNRLDLYTSFSDIQSVLLLIVMVFLFLHLSYFTDVIFIEGGFKIRNVYLTETIFHLGIINGLRNTYPPLYPFASNTISLSHYHLNMHLEIEMFNRFLSIDTLKLTFFYFPLLYFYLLVFIPYIFIRKNRGTRFLGALTGILMFGSNLSFIPALLCKAPYNFPWAHLFTTTIWPLLTLNGTLPALFIMFLCIIYLKKFYEDGNLLYLLVFAILGFSSYGFKSSMGPHIMGVAFLTGIVSVGLMQDKRKGIFLCVVSALTIIAIAVDMTLLKEGIGNNIFTIDLFNRFHFSLKYFGVLRLPWFLYPVIFPVYTLATFGVRTLGFYVSKDAFSKKLFNPTVVFLTIFAISGFLLSDMIFIGYLVPSSTNNAMWFSVQSLMGCWLLLSYFLLRISHYGKKSLLVVFIIILLSAPSAVQFFTLRFDNNYYTVDSNAIEVTKFLSTTPPSSVVLHPQNLKGPSLASNLAGRPSVLNFFRSFATQNIGKMETDNRIKDVNLFFDTNAVTNRYSILNKYKVDYVYAPLKYSYLFDKESILLQVLKNSEYIVYRVESNSSLR